MEEKGTPAEKPPPVDGTQPPPAAASASDGTQPPAVTPPEPAAADQPPVGPVGPAGPPAVTPPAVPGPVPGPDAQWQRPGDGQYPVPPVPQWQQPQWQPPVAWQPPPNWDPGVGSQPEQIVPFTAPPAKLKPWAIVTVIVAGLLLMVGGYVVVVVRVIDRAQEVALDDDRYTAPDPWVSEPELSPSPSPSEATPEETVPSGPRASTYPVREDDDLNRVCDGWYYPQSPKFAGKAPHQISVGVIDSTALPSRNIMSSVSVPDLRESIWRAWMPTDPTKTQLVGCVDLVKTGGTLKSCKFDDPKPEKIAMKRATYRVRLYETATGKKLVDKAAVTGEDEDCPSLVFLMGNEPILSKVGDRQLYEFFRPYVMKK